MRGLTIARRLKEHEFLFVANDDALEVLEPEFRVYRLPNLGTVFKNYQVDLLATVTKALPILAQREKYLAELSKVVRDFKPAVCMTDLEYFVPRLAKREGLPCLTLDHQHVITLCEHHLPPNLYFDAFLQGLTPRYLFRPSDYNLLISFYAPPLLPNSRARVVPPILREAVLKARPRDEGHVLVYQSNSTHKALLEFLQNSCQRTCYVFGYQKTAGQDKNVIFMPKSEEVFLRLLANASYVIQGGSHTLMSEALYLGKPILSIPLEAMVEQRFNALYLEKLGYGMQARMEALSTELLQNFEAKLLYFRAEIAKHNFCGNDLVFSLVESFIETGHLDLA